MVRIVTILSILILTGCPFTKKNDSDLSDRISIAWEAAPRAFDSRYAQDATSQYLEDLIYCSLINFGKDGEVISELAESWEWSSPTTLQLQLKEGIKFSDGSTVSATDVKATYDFFASEATPPSPRSGAFRSISNITVEGDNSLTFHLQEPDASFVTNLVVGILPQKLASMPLIEDPQLLIGCGPFKIDTANLSRLTLTRNPEYNLAAPAASEMVVIEYVKEEQTRFAKLVKGEIDIVQNMISRDKLQEISRRYPQLKVLRRPGLNTTYLGFNMQDKIAGNAKVRLAIAHALDREAIIQHLLQGLAQPSLTLLPPHDRYFDQKLTPVTHDLEAANQLLDEAGYPRNDQGIRFEISYKTTTDITRVSIARAIASQLRQIGIDVRVQPLEWGRFRSDVDQGLVQMWSLSWVGFKDPSIYQFAFASENFPPNGPNRGRFSHPELDKLLHQASITTNEEKRVKLYHDVQRIVHQELPYVFLWHEEIFAVANIRLNHFDLYADGRLSSLRRATKK